MRVSFFLYRSKINARLECPVFCRITVNGERKQFSTSVFVSENNWKNSEVVNTPLASDYNALLVQINSDLYSVYTKMYVDKENITALSIYNKYTEKTSPVAVLDKIFKHYNQYYKADKNTTKETKRAYKNRYKVVHAYFENRRMLSKPPSILDNRILTLFCEHLLNIYTVSYTRKCIQFLQQVVRRAFLDGLADQYYTQGFVMPKIPKKQTVYLSPDQVMGLEAKKYRNKMLEKARNKFLFQTYTGMAYIDSQNYTKEWIKQGKNGKTYIFYARQKTGETSIVPMTETLYKFLRQTDPKKLRISLANYNKYLKMIGEDLGLEFSLTSHIARITCGSWFLNQGVSMQAVSKILGHSDIRTTQKLYAKASEYLIENELNRVNIKAHEPQGKYG